MFKTIKNKGATLIEVVIALVIFILISTSITGLFYYSTRMEKTDQVRSETSNLAVTLLETIDRNVNTSDDFNTLITTSYIYVPDTDSYIYKIDVEQVKDGLKMVGVTIYHRKPGSRNDDVEPDPAKVNDGRILRLGTYIERP